MLSTDEEKNDMQMSDVREVPSRPSTYAGQKSKGSKLKQFLRRWWWALLLVFLAGVIVVAVILCYVAFPRIAQSDINKSTLTVTSLILTNPTAKSFHLVQDSTIINKTPYHPQLDAFNASLALQGKSPYGSIVIPHLHATASSVSHVDQDVTIEDMGAFTEYNVAVLNEEEVTLAINGRTALHEMAFPTSQVNYDKLTTMKGLNKLSGFNVTSFTIKLLADKDGTNMVGFVYIPNPTVMTLTMGNVTFSNSLPATPYSPAKEIGNTTLTDLVLRPGNNTIPMKSIVDQTAVLDAISFVYKDGFLPVDITGLSSVYNGQHLPYFEAALQSLTQRVRLDVGSALKAAAAGLNTTTSAQVERKLVRRYEKFDAEFGARSKRNLAGF